MRIFLFFTSIGGLAVRIGLSVKENVSLLFSVGASLIDRLMTMAALLFFTIIFIPVTYNYVGLNITLMSLFCVVLILGVFLLIPMLSQTRLVSSFNLSKRVIYTLRHMQSIFIKPKLLGSIIITSLAAQLFYFASVYMVVKGMGIDIGFIQLLTVLPMIALVSSLPIGFGGWGVREGAFVYGLGFLGVGIEQAFSCLCTSWHTGDYCCRCCRCPCMGFTWQLSVMFTRKLNFFAGGCLLVMAIAVQVQVLIGETNDYTGLRLNLGDFFIPFAGLLVLCSLISGKSSWPQWAKACI